MNEMKEPKISVIVANYNHEKYIELAISSILDQTYKNFELIIVDDASTDNSREVINDLASLDKRISKPLFLNKNMGKWNALNKGIAERSTGTLITTQDADDASAPQRLELTLKTLLENKSFHTLCGFKNCGNEKEVIEASRLRVVPEELGIMSHNEVVTNVHKGYNTPGINHYFTGSFEVHGASALFYKQLWTYGMKFMPGNMGLRCQKAEDSDMNTKLTLLLQKTSVLKAPLYCYRRGTTTNPAYLENL